MLWPAESENFPSFQITSKLVISCEGNLGVGDNEQKREISMDLLSVLCMNFII